MSKTEVTGKQLKDGSVELVDLASEVSDVLDSKADTSSLATVATSGSYTDLADKPSIPSVDGLASETYVDTAVADVQADVDAEETRALAAEAVLQGNIDDEETRALAAEATEASERTADVDAEETRALAAEAVLQGNIDTIETDYIAGDAATLASANSYTDSGVAALVNSAPAVLNTLNELALALGSDPDFATTVSGNIGAIDTRVTAAEGNITTLQTSVATKAATSSLAAVATSGSYVDLTNKPTIPTDLDSLTDVTITTPAADQIIKYNGTAWVNSAAAAAGATTLDELTDVVIATPLKGHLVVHNGTNFVNSNTIETSGAAIKGLIVKGATDQTANSFEAQDSSGTAYVTINVDTHFGTAGQTAALFTRAPNNNKKALIARASAAPNGSTFEVQNNAGTAVLTVGSTGTIGLTPGDWNISGPSYLNIGLGSSGSFFSIGGNGQVGLNYGTTFDDSSQLSIVTRATQSGRKGISVKYGSAGPTGNGYELLSSTATQLFAVSSSGAISAGNTTLTSTAAATKGLIVQGAASQSANLLELQNSAGTAVAQFTNAGAVTFASTVTAAAGTSYIRALYFGANGAGLQLLHGSGSVNGVALGRDTTVGESGLSLGSYMTAGSNQMRLGWGGGATGYSFTGLSSGAVGLGTTSPGGQFHVVAKSDMKGLIVQGAASQTANLLELQNSAGTALVSVSSAGTLHAARYTETVANAFTTTLTPSTGTLTVDTSTGNAVLGTLAAAVTTWAFTNVPTENSKVTSVTVVLVGNATYTYGDACSVNGSAVTNGIMWSGGTAPTATAGTDLITFVIVKDSAGTIKVLGSATTNFS